MTQASDLGGIANQLAAFYRARVNVNLQALTTQHYGSVEPPAMYANMVWFDSGTGYVKLRSPTNSAWQIIGTIGPPMKFTNVDIPQTAWTTGDVKATYKVVADAGWVFMNDGTIGDGSSAANTRANPDTWALFWHFWHVVGEPWCTMYAGGTFTPTGRGASAEADFAAHRHLSLPRALGRAMVCAGAGPGLTYVYSLGTWWGAENVALDVTQIPSHTHTFSGSVPAHTHTLPIRVGTSQGGGSGAEMWSGGSMTSSSAGGGTISGNTSAAGSGVPHFNLPPSTYLNFMIKL